ncbi:MAG: hypothetical protein KTR31_20955 [Myxococcales bacterium]|nr:hypothetical protein [Myxococcales bacterium]
MRPALVSLAVTLAGCELPAPEYEYGIPVGELLFAPYTGDVGVHPDRSVMADPNNPFRDGLVGDGELRFETLEGGPVVGFYGFATANAIIPFGENQWYAANQLHAIYDQELVTDLADLAITRDLAIRGYQAVLDDFTDTAFTFDPTGRFQFDLLAPSVLGILDLGGQPQNGWGVVDGPDGFPIAVQSGGSP